MKIKGKKSSFDLIVLGGSSGGIEALLKIIPNLNKEFSIPIVIVMHQLRTSKSSLADVLQAHTKLRVKEPEDKEKILHKYIYVAPPNYHLMIEEDKTFSFSNSELVNYSRPSIDVLFETAADAFGERLIGVLITGSNADGAHGIKQIKEKGGLTIVEDPSTADSPVMPKAAINMSKVDYILSVNEIFKKLNSLYE